MSWEAVWYGYGGLCGGEGTCCVLERSYCHHGLLSRLLARVQVALFISAPACLIGTYLKYYTDVPDKLVIILVILGCASMTLV